jgi:mRNA interferase HigB
MRVIGSRLLADYMQTHPPTRTWLVNWLADVERSAWKTPQDIKLRYVHASFLAGNKVVFNVKGNDHRLVVQVAYQTGIVQLLWIGTHADYSRRVF